MTIKTQIYLDKEFVNMKSVDAWELIAPSGMSITKRICPTDDEKRLYADVGIIIHPTQEERDVNEKNINISDIMFSRVAPQVLEIESENEDDARRKYNKLKAVLPEYRFLGHECETITGEPCKRFKSQRKITE